MNSIAIIIYADQLKKQDGGVYYQRGLLYLANGFGCQSHHTSSLIP